MRGKFIMTELKTLKDFRRPKSEEHPYSGEWAMGVNETCDKLRQEAIKRIKSCDRTEDFTTNNMCGFYYDTDKKDRKPRASFCELCKRDIWFYNLTEEELK